MTIQQTLLPTRKASDTDLQQYFIPDRQVNAVGYIFVSARIDFTEIKTETEPEEQNIMMQSESKNTKIMPVRTQKKNSGTGAGFLTAAAAGAAIALATGIILLFIAALAAYKTADPDPLTLPLSLAALYCGMLAGGIAASRILGRAAYDAAAVSGAIVSAVMLVVSVFVKEHNIYPLWIKLVMHAGVFAAMLLGALIGRRCRSSASHRTRSSARRRHA